MKADYVHKDSLTAIDYAELQKNNEELKQKLNWIAFGDEPELALRYLRKIGYVDFDEERKVYINKHNNEPFLLDDEEEKAYYIKEEELNEYTKQLEYQNQELKKQLQIKHEGFMASTDELCKHAEENQKLKEPVDYLKSGEYINQLKFERDILQDIVDKSEVSKEDKDFIDMTHRNTELLKENQELKRKIAKHEDPEDLTLMFMYCDEKAKDKIKELKKQLEVGREQYNDLVEEKENLQEQLSSNTLQLEELKNQTNKGLYNTCLPYTTGYNKAIKDKEIQQEEFINYLEEEIKLYDKDIQDFSKDYKVYFSLINDLRVGKAKTEEILQKYEEIIGYEDEQN